MTKNNRIITLCFVFMWSGGLYAAASSPAAMSDVATQALSPTHTPHKWRYIAHTTLPQLDSNHDRSVSLHVHENICAITDTTYIPYKRIINGARPWPGGRHEAIDKVDKETRRCWYNIDERKQISSSKLFANCPRTPIPQITLYNIARQIYVNPKIVRASDMDTIYAALATSHTVYFFKKSE